MSIIESPGLAHSPPTRASDSADPLVPEQSREHRAVNSVRAVAPPAVGGKFLTVDGEKFVVRGVTYGPFGADGSPAEYGDASLVARDFTRIAAAGFNSVRVYTVPPVWLLDAAAGLGLRALVGLPWEQHVAALGPPAAMRPVENLNHTIAEEEADKVALAGESEYAAAHPDPAALV